MGRNIRQTKRVPVYINYSVGRTRFAKKIDEFDLALIMRIQQSPFHYWFPNIRMPVGDESRRNDEIGITHVHHFYTQRNLRILASFARYDKDKTFLFSLTKVAHQITNLYRLTHQSGTWGAGGGPLSGTLYVPSLIKELSIYKRLESAIRSQLRTRSVSRPINFCISTSSSTDLRFLSENQIDYVFVDPPFGSNLMYSELNFLWEAWLKVVTNNQAEAIENNSQGKSLPEYQGLT